ncbi:hypothetical protein Taro_011025 [Colocasia esculenta]|uniref:Uncharacterized protein n=1 Tax=Colocasia esculenta TaxID=4460 RepID=A0A843U4R9_COLES|nr:hypothetical protein [Colocasia esculenta]
MVAIPCSRIFWLYNACRSEKLASISLDAGMSIGIQVWTLTPAKRPGLDAKIVVAAPASADLPQLLLRATLALAAAAAVPMATLAQAAAASLALAAALGHVAVALELLVLHVAAELVVAALLDEKMVVQRAAWCPVGTLTEAIGPSSAGPPQENESFGVALKTVAGEDEQCTWEEEEDDRRVEERVLKECFGKGNGCSNIEASSRLSESDSEQEVKDVSEFT